MLNECIDTVGDYLNGHWAIFSSSKNAYFGAILCFGTLKNNGLCVSDQNQIFHLPGLDLTYQTASSEVPLYKVLYFDPH